MAGASRVTTLILQQQAQGALLGDIKGRRRTPTRARRRTPNSMAGASRVTTLISQQQAQGALLGVI
jgi:hypothetical protein